jgi:hypothetical protein
MTYELNAHCIDFYSVNPEMLMKVGHLIYRCD